MWFVQLAESMASRSGPFPRGYTSNSSWTDLTQDFLAKLREFERKGRHWRNTLQFGNGGFQSLKPLPNSLHLKALLRSSLQPKDAPLNEQYDAPLTEEAHFFLDTSREKPNLRKLLLIPYYLEQEVEQFSAKKNSDLRLHLEISPEQMSHINRWMRFLYLQNEELQVLPLDSGTLSSKEASLESSQCERGRNYCVEIFIPTSALSPLNTMEPLGIVVEDNDGGHIVERWIRIRE